MKDDATQAEVRSSDPLGLPPLPQCYMHHWINCPFKSIELFKAEQMRAYAAVAVAAERELWRAQAARDTVETRWAMREQIAAWLDGQGQPGYATEVRCREWA